MPVYLDEENISSDDTTIGFPHLLLCMGLVYVADGALHGIHLTSRSNTEDAIKAFKAYLNKHSITGGTALYGSANHGIRYGKANSKASWKQEMTYIANEIGYTGKVRGFDTAILKPKKGTYVEYQTKADGTCKIFYKRNEKMNFESDLSQRLPKVGPGGALDEGVGRKGFVKKSANIIVTKSNKGQLHELNYSIRQSSFDVK
ncbi:hypothetical protein A9Q99_10110 [Gammaproteobacteria bacterium 45_16_T64]|nr:hypothetical protein A9Q99_10110 [Gammaproteobacteria bacterium 45_16_T64]